jgi:5'-3' exonuclease
VAEPEERAQKRHLYSELQRLSLNIAWAQGYEADDVIATLAKEYSTWCNDVRIVGTDKDAAQCLNEHVTQYIPPVGDKDWEVRDVAAATAKFGVPPELMTLFQGLMGDTSDNIPGVKGIGKVKAAELANKYRTLTKLAEGMATEASKGAKSAVLDSLAANWENLVVSIKLATLDTGVPLDTESLLVVREPLPHKPRESSMDVPFDGFTGNETPMPEPPPPPPSPPAPKEPLKVAAELYQEKLPEIQKAAKDAELLEQEHDREREQSAENDTTSNEPGDKAAESVRRHRAPATQALVTQTKYGLVTADLQPMDLTSAYQMSGWLFRGGLFAQFKSEAQIFTVMVRAKELGIGITTALAGHHIIDGKPVASADLIRALAERDANFEYLMPIEITATKVTWRGKHKKQPTYVDYSYTVEDAKLAGLIRSGNYGKSSNWQTRPQDMMMKTAGSKLARLLWPGATMGCYCPEEMGYTAEELEAREAA